MIFLNGGPEEVEVGPEGVKVEPEGDQEGT